MNDRVDDHLEHHGIKGMRWGVRRKIGPGGRVVGKSKPKPSTDYKTTAPLRKRPSHTLSNMQLKKVNDRMQLESKFRQMNPTRKDRGRDFANNILKATTGVAGTAALLKVASNPGFQAKAAKGAQVIAFRASGPGRLLTSVRKGKFG